MIPRAIKFISIKPLALCSCFANILNIIVKDNHSLCNKIDNQFLVNILIKLNWNMLINLDYEYLHTCLQLNKYFLLEYENNY